ncbi:MAG: oxygen-dependent coproporphyrinogen oxidase [Flavobacteriales bacterium]
MREIIVEAFKKIQDEICFGLEGEDGLAKFHQDIWTHPAGGGGRTRIIQHGNVFEKGGVNFSAVEGDLPAFMIERLNAEARTFFATGVSIVIHPQSPLVPIVHMNIRYFEANTGESWFGGGIDLTPIYVDVKQAKAFHEVLKATCDRFDSDYYTDFKRWADDYFFIKHRNETRGIGGVFFDYLRPSEQKSKDELFAFTQAIGHSFLKAYLPIVASNKELSYNDQQKQWQMMRRGRYVEFNLVYDRGTRFGLETSGRIESILMSLPEQAGWTYNFVPAAGSEEEKTLLHLKKGIHWLGF